MREKILRLLLATFLISVLLGIVMWRVTPPHLLETALPENTATLYPGGESYISGYDVTDSTFVPNNEDPQIGFLLSGQDIQTIVICFQEPLAEKTNIGVYYAVGDEGLTQEKCVERNVAKGSVLVAVDLQSEEYTHIRLDINGTFSLDNVYACPVYPTLNSEHPSPEIWKILVIWAVLFVFAGSFLALRGVLKEKLPADRKWINTDAVLKTFLVCAAFLSYFVLAKNMSIDMAPDEDMRNDIPYWIYTHHALPRGDEVELLENNVWGFSYGFSPCLLPTILATLMMRIFSLFSSSEASLLLASRMISSLSSVGSMLLCFAIGDRLFKNKWSSYFLAIFIGFLPQVTFISSYFNNDAFSLFACTLILYYLITGREQHWSIRKCIGLAAAMSACILTYYNAYGWLIVCVVFCIVSCLMDKTIEKKAKFLASRVVLIAGIVLCLAGWAFIRNALLYDGDFLGREISNICAKNWAEAGHYVHVPSPPQSQGLSLGEMLFDGYWIPTTLKSLVAVFGGMNIFVSMKLYYGYLFLIVLGLCTGIYYVLKERNDFILYGSLVIAIIAPVCVSIMYSYTSDYQPQGRYIMPMLPALAVFVVLGYDRLALRFQNKKHYYIYFGTTEEEKCVPLLPVGVNISVLASCAWLFLFLLIYFKTIIPNLLG